MSRKIGVLSALLLLLGVNLHAHAESGTVLSVEYSPLIERSNGRFISCGVHFSSVVQGTDHLVGAQGSWNFMYFPGSYPAMTMKAVAIEPVDDNSVQKLSLAAAHFKGRKFNTFAMSQDAGEYESRLIFHPLTDSLEMYESFQIEMPYGFWVFLTIQGSSNDFSFKLPPFDGANGGDAALMEFSACNSEAMSTWMDENLRE